MYSLITVDEVVAATSETIPVYAQDYNGWILEDRVLSDPGKLLHISPLPPTAAPKVSPVEFKMLFTTAERIAIKSARVTDLVLQDAYEILDDPRLTYVDLALQSNIDMVDYLVAMGWVSAERAVVIKTGKIL